MDNRDRDNKMVAPAHNAIPAGRYRHFKGGEYELLYVAKHSETMEEMVVYRALYGEGGIWVRPAAMWSEEVAVDGQRRPRFAPVAPTAAPPATDEAAGTGEAPQKEAADE